MAKIYLFDWGDTLMVDFPQYQGPMCDWPEVDIVSGALETLCHLSEKAEIYIATNAEDSSVEEIQLAFARVGLAPFIKGYFCRANTGFAKGTPRYFEQIVLALNAEPQNIIMVGDTLDKDILPAVEAGLSAVWYCPETLSRDNGKYRVIRTLEELTQ